MRQGWAAHPQDLLRREVLVLQLYRAGASLPAGCKDLCCRLSQRSQT